MKKNAFTHLEKVWFGLPVWLLLLALSLSSSTCERPLDLELPEETPKLVLVCNFTNGEELRVRVSRSRSILDESPEDYIGDAVVELYEADQLLEVLSLFTPSTPRLSPYYATQSTNLKVGVDYLIKVSAPGFEPVMSHSMIPQKIDIQTFSISDLEITNGPQQGSRRYTYRISLSFNDPPKIDNYYHLNFYQQIQDYLDIGGGDTLILRDYLQPVIFNSFNDNNFLLAYFGGGVLVEDGPNDGRTLSYDFPMTIDIYPENQIIGKIFVELRAVSKEYYLFHNSLSRQQNNNGGGSNEPIFIYNNIENGQGIFAGYSQSLDSLHIIH